MDIVLNKPIDWEAFNPKIYENEPYNYDVMADEFLEDYLTGIRYLLGDYIKTGDERFLTLAQLLLPAACKIQSN